MLQFWFDRGVDGMRVDAIRHMYEDESFADEPVNPDFTPPPDEDTVQNSLICYDTTKNPWFIPIHINTSYTHHPNTYPQKSHVGLWLG